MVTEKEISKQYQLNAASLLSEIEWLQEVVTERLKIHSDGAANLKSIYEIRPPLHELNESVFAEFLNFYKLNFDERIILMLALLPHVHPQWLESFLSGQPEPTAVAANFACIKNQSQSGFLPTAQTALFILAGSNLQKRFRIQDNFNADHFFRKHNILHLSNVNEGESFLNSQLILNDEYVDLFTNGRVRKPQFSTSFPAKLLTTPLEWKDLIVDDTTAALINELKIWLQHSDKLMNEWGMHKKLKPGYKVLFHGPPGTGKTLTASLLGKIANRDVYRIDLSMVISKYIGETEKNLEKVFAKAEHKNWILFFDEADALFGKRTSVSDAHDKYANQEISYLLQRLEDYNGLVILASNMRSNVDEAFSRRLQNIIYFPMPKPQERIHLWQNAFSPNTTFESTIDLEIISNKYELAGGSIINVVHYASLMALHRNENVIRLTDVISGIKKEYQKSGKTI